MGNRNRYLDLYRVIGRKQDSLPITLYFWAETGDHAKDLFHATIKDDADGTGYEYATDAVKVADGPEYAGHHNYEAGQQVAVVTVDIAISAFLTEGERRDAISHFLTEIGMADEYILDWQYNGGKPAERFVTIPDRPMEGDAFLELKES